MVYIFDTSSFIVLGHYYPKRFPHFWEKFNASVKEKEILSAREVHRELEGKCSRAHLEDWVKINKTKVFLVPSSEETKFVEDIFSVPHFQQLISLKKQLRGDPVADPFVIAMAKIRNGCVVTEETKKPNAARIPNVCDHFKVKWCNLEQFMETRGWEF